MSKKITKRNIGGISLTTKWKDIPKQDVLDYFLQNSDFKILTDTSVSCVNYVATLRQDKESPFYSVRSGIFREPVRSMLMKVCIHSVEKRFIPDFRDNGGIKPIETMSPEDIIREAKIQDDLFRKSYIENVAEPICPSIIYVQTDISKDEHLQEKYYKWMDKQLIERNPDTKPGKDHHITYSLFNYHPLSIIFMELAEGYYTLYDLWTHPMNQGTNELLILQNLLFITMYELYQVYHTYGIVHGDIHFGNILVNPSYIYVSNDRPGKILIIDFGKSFYETPDPNKREYDAVIYHQNTQAFETILSPLPDIEKNDFFRNNYQKTGDLRNQMKQSFLDRLFQGSIERWREWSKENIHFPYNDYHVGGLLHKQLPKQTKTITYNKKEQQKNMEWDNSKEEFDPRIHLDPSKVFRITQEMADKYLADLTEEVRRMNENPPPKVEPASPRTAEREKKMIAEALNRPLEIQHFQNPYIYPIGNPKKVAPIILTPSERDALAALPASSKIEKKRRTRAKRNSF
jgi:hypothetical protein